MQMGVTNPLSYGSFRCSGTEGLSYKSLLTADLMPTNRTFHRSLPLSHHPGPSEEMLSLPRAVSSLSQPCSQELTHPLLQDLCLALPSLEPIWCRRRAVAQQLPQLPDQFPFPPGGLILPLKSGDVERAEAVQDSPDRVMLLRFLGLVHHVVAPVCCACRIRAG